MPELPEVETVRRGLEPLVVGARVTGVETRRANLRFPFPETLGSLTGLFIERVDRRAKYLLFGLSDGRVMLSHLGMTGAWRVDTTPIAEPTRVYPAGRAGIHDHLVIGLEREGAQSQLIYNDPRRFGFVSMAPSAAEAAELQGIGPEPLGNGFSPEHLSRVAAGRAAPIKAVLLDQKTVAGLGNIYVCEALWRAGIAPTRPARQLSDADIGRLVAVLRAVLTEAIAAGGSTFRDFIDASGSPGYFQHSFDVYGRQGEACRRPGCAGTIARIVQSGRSSFCCPVCQRK